MTKLVKLLALAALVSFSVPAYSADDSKERTKASKPAKQDKSAVAPKYCPTELSNKQIEDFATHKKATMNNIEFLVGPKFDKFAGKRYLDLQKEGKAPNTISLKTEKIKAEKAVCTYTYSFKTVSKKAEHAGKEVDRTGRVRIYTMLGGDVSAPVDAKTKKN